MVLFCCCCGFLQIRNSNHMMGLCCLYSKSIAFCHPFLPFILFCCCDLLWFYSSPQIPLIYFQSNNSPLGIFRFNLCFGVFCFFLNFFPQFKQTDFKFLCVCVSLCMCVLQLYLKTIYIPLNSPIESL